VRYASTIDGARAAYVQLVDEVDATVGKVMALARRRGRPFKLVVTADHGELFGEHGGFAHGGGFVPELLDIPFIIFDSRRAVSERRCELMLSSEAMRYALVGGNPTAAEVLELDVSLGRATIDARAATLKYQLSKDVLPHAGTWRNIHREAQGTLPYPIERCQ